MEKEQTKLVLEAFFVNCIINKKKTNNTKRLEKLAFFFF